MEKIIKTTKDTLYRKIAKNIEEQIHTDVLKIGDKLPSIRMVCRQQGVSMSTVQLAYLELESKSLIESRPQSGFYVSQSGQRLLALPATSKPELTYSENTAEDLVEKVYHTIGENSQVVQFSLGIPSKELLPIARLNKCVVQAMRELNGSGTAYEQIEGNAKLRRHIARWSFNWNGSLSENDIITTSGCINAIAYCMMALTKRGDAIAVESPLYFGILQLAKSLGLRVMELPTHPRTGIELDALKHVLIKQKPALVLLMSNFNNPLGSCMPDEHKKEVVQLVSKYGVPLIEDDLYGDIYFGNNRPKTCKTYDEEGWVLWCSSVSKTLAPGYRVGWVAPGKFFDNIKRIKMLQSISSTSMMQEAIANFFATGRYESHLRKLRNTLYTNSLQYTRAIGEYFPKGTKISQPQGGLFLWVELDEKMNTCDLHERAMEHHISIAPGSIFTLQDQFANCMRLSFGQPWNEKIKSSLELLGKLLAKG
jgi:DNA-binding transcriptional MocR family regulator